MLDQEFTPTANQSIRGMATMLCIHLAAWNAVIARAPGFEHAVEDLRGLTLEALRDAQRYLPKGEIERIMADVQRGAERANQEAKGV